MPRATVRTAVGKLNLPCVMDGKRLLLASLLIAKIFGRMVFKSLSFMLSAVRPFLKSPASSLVSPFHCFPRRMSISVFGVGATPLLKTIPTPFEKSDLLEFTFGPVPIIKLIAGEAVTLKIDFICAAPDFFVTWRVVCGSILCVRLNGTCVKLQSHISLAFQCHTRVLSSLS